MIRVMSGNYYFFFNITISKKKGKDIIMLENLNI